MSGYTLSLAADSDIQDILLEIDIALGKAPRRALCSGIA
jgi:hypothetical protein